MVSPQVAFSYLHVYRQINPNSLDNKGSCWILLDFYCSVTMLRELVKKEQTIHVQYMYVHLYVSEKQFCQHNLNTLFQIVHLT